MTRFWDDTVLERQSSGTTWFWKPRDCVYEKLVLGLGEGGDNIAETADDAALAEHDHRVEERRRDGLADDGHARGVDEQAGFDSASFGDSAGSVVASVVIPFGKRFKRHSELREQIRNFRVLPEFVLGSSVP